MLKFDRHIHRMSIEYRNTVGLDAESELCVHPLSILDFPKEQLGLLLNFLRLSGDVGDDIIDNVQVRHTRITGPGDSLHCRREDLPHTKGQIEWFERHHQSRSCAVGAGDEQPFPSPVGPLSLQQRQVIPIDFWDQERYIWFLPVSGSIGADDETRFSQDRF